MSALVHAFTRRSILTKYSGIMDTVNSTLAHPQETRLPKEFYDTKGRAIIDKIGVEEWFSGYMESREYRQLGKSIVTTFHAFY
jgi:hypothetical protein